MTSNDSAKWREWGTDKMHCEHCGIEFIPPTSIDSDVCADCSEIIFEASAALDKCKRHYGKALEQLGLDLQDKAADIERRRHEALHKRRIGVLRDKETRHE